MPHFTFDPKSGRRRGADTGDEFNRRLFGWYLANLASGPAPGRFEQLLLREVRALFDAPEIESDGIDPEEIEPSLRPLYSGDGARRRRAVRQLLKPYAAIPDAEDPMEANLAFSRAEFGFDEIDSAILRLIEACRFGGPIDSLADEVFGRLRHPARAVAALINVDAEAVMDRLNAKGRLAACGFLTTGGSDAPSCLVGDCGAVQMTRHVAKVMASPFVRREEWLAALFGEPATAALEWEDFVHLGAERDLAVRVLAGAVECGAAGVNILVHGPVGTGKTEFCKALAARAGLPIWSVGEADSDGDEPERHERMAAMRLAQRLLARRGRSLILFDEAEDLIEGEGFNFPGLRMRRRRGSKAFVNRALEQNPVPVLWTCNDLDGIDPAVLRRMTLAIEVRTPPAPARARIWRKAAAEAAARLDEAAIERFARTYTAPPSAAANAVRAAKLAGGGPGDARTAIEGVAALLGLRPRPECVEAGEFNADLTNCAEDLGRLVSDLARPGAPRAWSLCLQGPPGTGKSLFARHVAERLGMEVSHKRASDLLSMWVGESEKNIAAAFAEARAAGALLVFDEADSLLADRALAVRGWEITQVNEMLTWMESHPLPFICTTNLMERLDVASLRRFTLKLRFDFLAPAQAALAFARFFGTPAPGRLPDDLAPGDFATARRRRDLRGEVDAALLTRWLEEEVEARGARPRPIGFGRALN